MNQIVKIRFSKIPKVPHITILEPFKHRYNSTLMAFFGKILVKTGQRHEKSCQDGSNSNPIGIADSFCVLWTWNSTFLAFFDKMLVKTEKNMKKLSRWVPVPPELQICFMSSVLHCKLVPHTFWLKWSGFGPFFLFLIFFSFKKTKCIWILDREKVLSKHHNFLRPRKREPL